MKNLLMFLFAFFAVVANAIDPVGPNAKVVDPIKIKVYGTGGIIVSGNTQHLCPKHSPETVCNTITMPQGSTSLAGGGGYGDVTMTNGTVISGFITFSGSMRELSDNMFELRNGIVIINK